MSASSLLTLVDAQLAFGDLPLLDSAALSVLSGERIGLVGRNGTGKSSLFATLEGRVPLDDIAALIFSGQGNSVSTNLLAELSARSICAVFCSPNQHPQAMLHP